MWSWMVGELDSKAMNTSLRYTYLSVIVHMTVCMGKRAFCDMAVFYK